MRPAISFILLLLAACGSSEPSRSHVVGDAAHDSLAAARRDSLTRAREDSINRAQPGYIIDSILSVAEEMRRFRAAVGGSPSVAFQFAATSRDQLVARFAEALAARDTAGLRRLAVSPREFIDLIYPESPYTHPPYRQSPSLVWSQIQLPSESGLRRLIERHGGRPLRVVAVTCPATTDEQGTNRLYTKCTVRFATGRDTPREGQLFGTIIERQGRYKFVSYANMY